jgi:membrane fusion protein (multidrug efflux system)
VLNNELRVLYIFLLLVVPHLACTPVQAQNVPQMPPAPVSAVTAKVGTIVPEIPLVGTAYYPEVSEVASEVEGKVARYYFEEGKQVRKGDKLVSLNADLLEKAFEAAQASHEQALAESEKAALEFKRMDELFKQDAVAEQVYDEARLDVEAITKRSLSLKAEMERLHLELKKKNIFAPFNGVVLKRHVDIAEWVAEGDTVASIARDDMIEVVVNVPESLVQSLRPGDAVSISMGNEQIEGTVFSIIPQGDIAARTFPVKIRTPNTKGFMEGMEARVWFPTGEQVQALLVPRDAVLTVGDVHALFVIKEDKAHRVVVQVAGYQVIMAGVHGGGLEEGMLVVREGSVRLRDGQPVVVKTNE